MSDTDVDEADAVVAQRLGYAARTDVAEEMLPTFAQQNPTDPPGGRT